MPTLKHSAILWVSSLLLAAQAQAQAPAPAPLQDAVKVDFLFSFSSNFGTIPLDGVTLSADRLHGEIFVTGDGPVRVFNSNGMEVFTFEDDPHVGGVRAVAALEGGDLLFLCSVEGRISLVRCNFRGEYISRLDLQGVPAEFLDAKYLSMRQQAGRLYLADPGDMKVLVVENDGTYVTSWDLAKVMGVEDKRQDLGIRGFNVDKEGNILFTVQALFKAFVLSPEGELQQFGTRGGSPGKFNVVSGIARDDAGYFYVADILKSVVIVFDPDFRFVREFGYRGRNPGSLAAPEDLAVADDKLYVSQHARRGVSVFQITRH